VRGMIVGVVAANDRLAAATIDQLAQELPGWSLSCSVATGVAIAALENSDATPVVLRHDRAHVGTLRGEFTGKAGELRGDFALIARAGRALRLARARFAGRPLYWMRIGRATVASSRLLPLAILARTELQLNLDHLVALFDARLWALHTPLPFVGACRIPTNAVVDVDAVGHVDCQMAPVALGPEMNLSVTDLARALRSELGEAVDRQCEGAKCVAILTGGGVDSSNLLAVAVQNYRRGGAPRVLPLAMDFGGPGDDRPYLRALCGHLMVEALRVKPAEGALDTEQDRVLDASTHATAPMPVRAALRRAKSAGAQVALLGDGSELLLDADAAVFGDFLLKSPLSALRCAAHFRAIDEGRTASWRRLVLGPLARHFFTPSVLDRRRAALRLRALRLRLRALPWAGPTLKARLSMDREYPPAPRIYDQRTRVTLLASSPLVTITQEYSSRWELASGLRMASPYLDDNFVQFVGRIPSRAIFAGARERGLLRESMSDIVPDNVRNRMDKAKSDHAFVELFAAMGGASAVRELVTMTELQRLGMIEAREFRKAFDQFAANPGADPSCWGTLWSAITAEAYVRWFLQFKAESRSTRVSVPVSTITS
jgi:asparagine synthetase B (glutamine-hydrolysing)